jgi:carbonic anhydrase
MTAPGSAGGTILPEVLGEQQCRSCALDYCRLLYSGPSEHQVNGELFPLAAHFVHRNDSGALAVGGVLYRKGEWNEDLAKLGAIAQKEINQPVPVPVDLRDVDLYTNHESYYRYSGSLTTPPCTEGVRWFVLKTIGHIAPEQGVKCVSLIGEDARGPQPLNARIVLAT